MSILEGMKLCFGARGDCAPTVRCFVADYKDENGIDYNQELFSIAPPGMRLETVARLAKEEIERKGRTVTGIVEILDGYTYAELEKLDRKEAMKHARVLYAHPDIIANMKRGLGDQA